jgi:type IV secretion system protein VirD4
VRPSEITAVRDESFAGQTRRIAVWATIGLALWLIPLFAVGIGALIEGRAPAVFPPGAVVRTVADAVRDALRPTTAPWWSKFPDPEHAPHTVPSLIAGLVLAAVIYAGVATWLWSVGMRRSGLRTRDRQRKRQMDGAQWAEAHELHRLLITREQLGDRVVLGTPRAPRVTKRLVAVEPGHSALVVAPTGQGKTESVIAPAILDWDGPVVCCSIKRDVYDLTAGHRATLGETRVLDPAGLTDPLHDRNAYWTPIPEARSWRAARTLADQMCGVGLKGAQSSGNEDYFANAAGELLSGLLFVAAHSPTPSMATVHDWLTHPGRSMTTIEALLADLQEDAEQDRDTRMNAPHALAAIRLRMVGKDPRSVEAIRTTVGNAIRAWNEWRFAHAEPDDPGVLAPDWLWSEPTKWERPGNQRTLYVIGPDADQDTYRGMFIGAITQIYNAYARAGQRGTPPAKRLLIVLDEVANMTPIPNLDRWVTAARGLGINLVLATQNLAQLDTVWGREKAETISSGPRVRMFGPGIADRQTLEYVERIGGQTALLTDSVSRTPYWFQVQTGRTTNTQWRPLLQQQELRELEPYTGIVFYGTTPPFHVDWRSAQTDPKLEQQAHLRPVAPGEDEVRHLSKLPQYAPIGVPRQLLSGDEATVDDPVEGIPTGWRPTHGPGVVTPDDEVDR